MASVEFPIPYTSAPCRLLSEALITPDEFAAGYKSVVGLVDMLRGSRKNSVEEKPVSYQLLTRKNLFDEENKKLLYAISQ